MKTKSGRFIIFDITEYLPGRKIPADFFHKEDTGPFYFQPSDWTEENWWGGSATAHLKKFPMCYSFGHETAEMALQEAEIWEAGESERTRRDAAAFASMQNAPIFHA